MHRRDGGDHRDVRPGQPRQRRDLAGRVHADLDHREVARPRGIRASVSGTPQWLLKLFSAAWTRPCAPSAARSISLVPVLPTEPVTATTRPGSGPAPRGPSAAQPVEHVRHDEKRRVRRDALRATRRPAPRPRPARAPRRRSRGRRAPRSAPRRDRPAQACGCRSRRPRRPVAAARAAGRRHAASRVQSAVAAGRPRPAPATPAPPPRSAAGHAPSPSSAATATLACSTSSKGRTSWPTIWPVSWPLPAISSASPGCSASTARQDRLGAVADLGRLGRAGPAPRRGSPPGPRCAGCRR